MTLEDDGRPHLGELREIAAELQCVAVTLFGMYQNAPSRDVLARPPWQASIAGRSGEGGGAPSRVIISPTGGVIAKGKLGDPETHPDVRLVGSKRQGLLIHGNGVAGLIEVEESKPEIAVGLEFHRIGVERGAILSDRIVQPIGLAQEIAEVSQRFRPSGTKLQGGP